MILKLQHGFVLVATLWILAIITIAASYFAERVSRSIAQAQKKQEVTQQLLEFANTRADILYRLGTTPFSFYGLGEPPAIALDDRPYHGSGEDIVRLQDNRGLLNVNFVEQNMMSRLLGQLGIPVEKRDAMIDALRDYIDTDDLRRLNGAETSEYAALGLPPPPNDWLASPYQLKNIIGWRDQPQLWENQHLLQLVTSSRVTGFNPNTAPMAVLSSLPGGTRDTAEALIVLRNKKPLYTLNQLAGFTSGELDPDFFLFFPGNSIRITQQGPRLPWAIQFSLSLTPRSEDAPWRIDYQVKTPVTFKIDNVDKIQKLPAQTSTSPDKDEAV